MAGGYTNHSMRLIIMETDLNKQYAIILCSEINTEQFKSLTIKKYFLHLSYHNQLNLEL